IMAAPLGRDTLPDHWSYGVCRDGRVFFINDKTHTTTWLHPRTGEPVNSGHMIRSDLPRGWEEGFTDEGASYFINHNVRATTFRHPVTGQISPENTEYTLQDRIESRMSKSVSNHRSPSMVTDMSKAVTTAPQDGTSGSGKVHTFGKRDHSIKRNLNIPVVVRGWLYKQDSSGMRLWKRKWFVLSDFCLFYYKDSREETVLGSIPLPSYVISPVETEDHINRKYAFKASHTGMRSYIYNKNSVIGSQAEHCGMRTYFFSADTQEDMNGWIRAMNQAALMQQSHTIKRDMEKSEKAAQQAVPQSSHVYAKSAHTETPSKTEREVDHSVRLAHRDEVRYGIEVQPRPTHTAQDERLSPDSGDAQNNGPAVVQVNLPPEQNGNVVYQRGFGTRTGADKHVQRKNTLAQVEHWVKVQKGDPMKSATSEYQLPRRTPPLKPKASTIDAAYQSLPKSPRLPSGSCSPPVASKLPSDYKYAHDRLSHFRMSTDERMATKEGMVWQLYEWQQRQQFRHGSPTAPIYTGPNFTDSSAFRVTVEMPRSISVPPSPCEVPPSLPGTFKPLSPRRPHTPSDRRTVRPLDEHAQDSTRSSSPGHICSHLSQIERRSMPGMGYITHTVSAPSLHGKTADDTYIQLKKDLEYLDLKVGPTTVSSLFLSCLRSCFRLKLSLSGVHVKLSRLCEQDKILQELESRIRTLKEDKDKLESVLDVSHQQMEQYQDQPTHAEKIAYQQKLLQEDVVHIRAEISKASTEMENAWTEYSLLEKDVDWLKSALQGQMNRSDLTQEKVQMRKELWRIEDVIAGLSANKANYKVTISSITNPGEMCSCLQTRAALCHACRCKFTLKPSIIYNLSISHGRRDLCSLPCTKGEEDVPPRPPLPQLYSPNEHPPAVPPLPKETTVIRHTSVRGLKRQSDERKRDREIGHFPNGDTKVELRPFLSDPELMGAGDGASFVTVVATGHDGGYQTLPGRGKSSSSLRMNQSSSISSYVTLRRAASSERPKSALERLYSGDTAPQQQRGRMSADEQLERMKRHQKALVRQRKRTLSHGDRHGSSSSRSSVSSLRPLSADLGSWKREQDFDLQLLERAVQGEESHSDEWLTFRSTTTPTQEVDLEPLQYDLDLSKELSMPQKVWIPERYVESEPEEALSPEEVEERHRKVERIKSILAKSSVQNLAPAVSVDKPDLGLETLDSALQEQERIITMSYALASEASLKSKMVAAVSALPALICTARQSQQL
uniref:Pleckstrin homology domain containing, family A member 7b n=1 Tax=Neogobius melanostomus TaxID=47308 RepID=A0A8C6SBM7_9GOBI